MFSNIPCSLISPASPCSVKGAMTCDQLKSCEETVNEIIKANQPVYAKETPLSLAKEIQGLRAVFDEVGLVPCSLYLVTSL